MEWLPRPRSSDRAFSGLAVLACTGDQLAAIHSALLDGVVQWLGASFGLWIGVQEGALIARIPQWWNEGKVLMGRRDGSVPVPYLTMNSSATTWRVRRFAAVLTFIFPVNQSSGQSLRAMLPVPSLGVSHCRTATRHPSEPFGRSVIQTPAIGGVSTTCPLTRTVGKGAGCGRMGELDALEGGVDWIEPRGENSDCGSEVAEALSGEAAGSCDSSSEGVSEGRGAVTEVGVAGSKIDGDDTLDCELLEVTELEETWLRVCAM
ncbi:hypothetical protein BV22DRAFT_1131711 [Leucogyrophana mollusca]|uniref:Uncharacterized protein n=1 Tax=Leucogyrophana mollusca TaxID=85980 RepID=A0ACB8BBD3_9AGAM|nr:hypothetical protein BV22DRAFT_1131711 [Leucogyrophana mollusca]